MSIGKEFLEVRRFLTEELVEKVIRAEMIENMEIADSKKVRKAAKVILDYYTPLGNHEGDQI